MREVKGGITLDDFVAYLPQHTYIFLPTREPWPGSSVNSQFPPVALLDKDGKPVLDDEDKPVMISPSAWLDINRPVHQMTWAPGMEMLIKDKVVADGGWIDKPEAVCLNLYRPPALKPKRGKVKPWLDHIKRIYPDDADHIIKYLAHRVQYPADKINHAIMLGGLQGIGKDTLLEPLKHAVGPWNFMEISPTSLTAPFNGYLKSVVLRISEARDTGESTRYAIYDHTKTLAAAPPDVLRVNEKNLREYNIFNCCGVIITTNYKTDGIYLPADDRRHYVAWSDAVKEDFSKTYWNTLWGWYKNGGIEAVTFYLANLDISAFDFKAPPPKTPAFWAIVDANRAPEEGQLADILDRLGSPEAVTLEHIINHADLKFSQWLDDLKNRRAIPYRLEKVKYVPVRNPDAESGLWRIGGVRQAVYAKKTLTTSEQIKAVERLQEEGNKIAGEPSKVIKLRKQAVITPINKNGNGRRKY